MTENPRVCTAQSCSNSPQMTVKHFLVSDHYIYIILFLERRERREKEREKHINASCMHPNYGPRDQTCNPGMCPNRQLNQQPFTFQDNAQPAEPAEPHWSGPMLYMYFLIFLLRFHFIFREKGREGVREGEKHQCMVASHVALTGDLARNPGMCPDWESNGRLLVHSPRSNH